ncbi:glutamate 5-kinase [Oceanobacillus jeddahense]|uniref:glutamate 5-kinase n=1 Tax=Oceanobacillus jeddahense TaxID=1462527 RepID=UPI000595E9FA|nr:glutamate 5-kinase [Oceanobacillus jeddahense]
MAAKRIVVKIGSSSLTNTHGEIDKQQLEDHVHALALLHQNNMEVILVSSGAIAAGFKQLGYSSRPVTQKGKQAAAAVGQGLLIQTYMEKLKEYDITAAQILLTRSDFSDQGRYRNAYATMQELLERRVIPIINENDTIAIDELTFGDNDMLSALVSGLIHADHLILLTDINGIYDKNPKRHPDAIRYDHLIKLSEELIEQTDATGSKVGTGGMKSKLMAAKMASSVGIPVFIGQGYGKEKLTAILKGEGDGTYIDSERKAHLPANKQWISLHSHLDGRVFIDEGAEKALMYHGSSLLSPGITAVEGYFAGGDVVEVYGETALLGRGQVKCSSEELKAVMKLRESTYIQTLPTIEVIHRDKWVSFETMKGELS